MMRTGGCGTVPLHRSVRWAIAGAAIGCLSVLAGPAASAPKPPFVGTTVCASCHVEQHARWLGSHHDLAMQEVDERTVLGSFDEVTFTYNGVTSTFFRRDGKFFVRTDGPDGALGEYEIAYTFGVDPLQQYLIRMPGGRLQVLGIAWDTRPRAAGGQRWFHLYPDERVAAGDPLHWTSLYQTWNLMCAECHSTNLRKRFDIGSNAYATTWDEIDVGCEACHGPGERHVAWASTRQAGQGAGDSMGLAVRFTSADAGYEVDACARCHARRHSVSAEDRRGRPLLDDFVPELLRADLYHADGQILDEVYVYGSFLQSKMYRRGVRCTDCHDPHGADLRAPGNAVCVQCHRTGKQARFPTLRQQDYDAPAHHHHAAGSAAAQCVSCHMPERVYMVIDPRRDHSFRIPRPDLSVTLGIPNACTGCHADKPPEWAAEAVTKWSGRTREPPAHFAAAIAAGRRGAREAEAQLVTIASDPQQPAIVRATALDLLRGYGRPGFESMVRASRDTDALVRAVAVGGLERLPPSERLAAAAPLLTDPVRAVRTEAARVLVSVPAESFDPAQRRAFEAALTEFTDAQMAQADTPAAHLNLAMIHTGRGDAARAEQAYLTAIRIDPGFLPARFNLANLYNATGRNRDAERILREGIARVPAEGELYYSLGLLLAEEQRLDEAVTALGKAAALLPHRARVQYNHGLALQHVGERDAAERALLTAYRIDPGDVAVVNALAVFYAQGRQWDRAAPYAQRLVELAPENRAARELREHIKAQTSPQTAP
jgi:predicted CXXCH cytochrome family protein